MGVTLSRIILGLLALAPMTGYDLKRHFDSTARHFWAADKAQIYRTLARLVDDGLAAVEVVPGAGAPDRQVHRITAEGRAALAEWLVSPVEAHADRDPFLARLFFADGLEPEALRRLLAVRRQEAEELLAHFESIRDTTGAPRDRAARFRLATLANGIAHMRAELAWLDEIEADLP
ncbi:PadR family transcriptional regulator [Microbacterium sp. JZ70]